MSSHPENWPYPRWIAHRGAGKLAPENTLAAFRMGASLGYTMFECDVKLSADDVPFLMHDTTLHRTTNALGQLGTASSMVGGDHTWGTLSQLDAGSWHSSAFAGEPIPCLATIAHYCIRNGFFLNIEIKPTPGFAYKTGLIVAQHAAQLWQGASAAPLLTSFDTEALLAAQNAEPQLPRGLLLESLESDWLESALALDCAAIICEQSLWTHDSMALAKDAGLRTLSYTVNDEASAQRLIQLGLDSIITDRVDLFPAPTSEAIHSRGCRR